MIRTVAAEGTSLERSAEHKLSYTAAVVRGVGGSTFSRGGFSEQLEFYISKVCHEDHALRVGSSRQ